MSKVSLTYKNKCKIAWNIDLCFLAKLIWLLFDFHVMYCMNFGTFSFCYNSIFEELHTCKLILHILCITMFPQSEIVYEQFLRHFWNQWKVIFRDHFKIITWNGVLFLPGSNSWCIFLFWPQHGTLPVEMWPLSKQCCSLLTFWVNSGASCHVRLSALQRNLSLIFRFHDETQP